jgi:hypothetical protein
MFVKAGAMMSGSGTEASSLVAGTRTAALAAALAGAWRKARGRNAGAGCGAAGACTRARPACLLCLLCYCRAAAVQQLPALGIPPGTGAWLGASIDFNAYPRRGRPRAARDGR